MHVLHVCALVRMYMCMYVCAFVRMYTPIHLARGTVCTVLTVLPLHTTYIYIIDEDLSYDSFLCTAAIISVDPQKQH